MRDCLGAEEIRTCAVQIAYATFPHLRRIYCSKRTIGAYPITTLFPLEQIARTRSRRPFQLELSKTFPAAVLPADRSRYRFVKETAIEVTRDRK